MTEKKFGFLTAHHNINTNDYECISDTAMNLNYKNMQLMVLRFL